MIGRPPVASEIRFWSKVNVTETCWEWVGAKNQQGYGIFTMDSESTRAHRYSYACTNGPIADGLFIDHICHNPACVNPSHLRAVTPKQNTEHRSPKSDNCKSGLRGVSKGPRGKWQGRVMHAGKSHSAGLYDTIEDAAIAVAALRNSLYTHNDLDRSNESL